MTRWPDDPITNGVEESLNVELLPGLLDFGFYGACHDSCTYESRTETGVEAF
jgi:hypothetical protein